MTHSAFLKVVGSCIVLSSCVEPFEPVTETFESALVIGATITDEVKQQEIYLSRTFALGEDGPKAERNAGVSVITDDNREYLFQESAPGVYVSSLAFGAQPDKTYRLAIETGDGKSYGSDEAQLIRATEIDSLYAARITTDLGEEGMGVFIDTSDPSEANSYYRYEYEETYKIIAPKWAPKDLKLDSNGAFIIVPRSLDEKVCYATDSSRDVILANTADFDKNDLERIMVRFVNRNNYILSHRYSILVRQYVQSREAHTYFETLRNFSSLESLFSETQPGFLAGNISSQNESDRVLGYFEVASVDEKRLYFNYTNFFNGEKLPPYIVPCVENSPPADKLVNQILLNIIKYFDVNQNPDAFGGPYIIVPRVCGDCTEIGSSERPEFWIEA